MKLTMHLETNSYDIHLDNGLLHKIADFMDVHRKVMVVTDSGVPGQYLDTVMKQLSHPYSYCLKAGESSKTLENFKAVCKAMLDHHFTRKDAVLALGGGVVGDLAGFAAASYMRGIDFINIPTTTLAQIDSSIGGKVAVDLDDAKNIIGAFYQPKTVIIDPLVLSTLSRRHYRNGLVEALKAGLIYDRELFEIFENEDIHASLETILERSLRVKKAVVEADEKEKGIRKILNFGHTIGHGIESAGGLTALLHGEAVALGMLPMIEDEQLRKRCRDIYKKLDLPLTYDLSKEAIYEWMLKDKKADGEDLITIVKVAECGKAKLVTVPFTDLYNYL